MAEVQKAKIVIFKKDNDETVARLVKALSTFSSTVEIPFPPEGQKDFDSHIKEHSDAKFFIYDLDFASQQLEPYADRTIFFNSKNKSLRDLITDPKPQIYKIPVIDIQSVPLPDLMRVLHAYIQGKSAPGVFNFVDKGALIIGEKIHSFGSIGKALDNVIQFIEEERPTLFYRANDIRQMMTSLTNEGLLRNQEKKSEHSFVDIQFSASPDKIVFTLRFPLGSLDFKKLPEQIINAQNMTWFFAWQGSDILMLTEHSQYAEIEIKAFIFSNQNRSNIPSFKSLLFQTSSLSNAASNLLTVPKSFTYAAISELQSAKLERQKKEHSNNGDNSNSSEVEQKNNEITDLKLEIAKLEAQSASFKKQSEQKEQFVKESLAKISEAKDALAKKRAENLKLLKDSEDKNELLRAQLADLEKQLAKAKEKAPQTVSVAKAPTEVGSPAISDDPKLAAIKSDLEEAHKDIVELKQANEKLKQELQKTANALHAAEATNAKKDSHAKPAAAGEKDLQAKVKELTSKEETLKQEVKKLNFKIETMEKSTKATHTELTDKAKLMEKKLEEAKQKEVELLKKIDTLNQQIKKNGKAA